MMIDEIDTYICACCGGTFPRNDTAEGRAETFDAFGIEDVEAPDVRNICKLCFRIIRADVEFDRDQIRELAAWRRRAEDGRAIAKFQVFPYLRRGRLVGTSGDRTLFAADGSDLVKAVSPDRLYPEPEPEP